MDTTRDQPLSTAGRLISAYGEQEPWKEDHDRATYCGRIEDKLAWGIVLFEGLSAASVRFQVRALRHPKPDDEAAWREFEEIYRDWAKAAHRFLGEADELAAEGYSVERLEDFRQIVAEVDCMIGNADFEPEIRPIEELEPMTHPECPRPDRYLS